MTTVRTGPRWALTERLVAAISRRWRGRLGIPQQFAGRVRVRVNDLFHVDLVIDEGGERVRVALTGWDRDLTRRIPGPTEIPLAELDDQLARVDGLMRELIPVAYERAYQAGLAGEIRAVDVVGLAPAVSREAALRAREARERGEDPLPRIDITRLEALVRGTWPGAEILQVAASPGEARLEGRPYGTQRVRLGIGQRGAVGAGVMVEEEFVGRLFGRPRSMESDEKSVRMSLAAIDEWLRLGVPSDDVLAEPILETN